MIEVYKNIVDGLKLIITDVSNIQLQRNQLNEMKSIKTQTLPLILVDFENEIEWLHNYHYHFTDELEVSFVIVSKALTDNVLTLMKVVQDKLNFERLKDDAGNPVSNKLTFKESKLDPTKDELDVGTLVYKTQLWVPRADPYKKTDKDLNADIKIKNTQ